MTHDRDELNATMLELYGFSYDDCCRLAYRYGVGVKEEPPLSQPIKGGYYALHRQKKFKGAGLGVKYTYTVHWNENRKRTDYLNELCPKDRGLWLCKGEYAELCADRWWDTPTYRKEHLQTYRRKITAIKKEYGLTSTEVNQFMRV